LATPAGEVARRGATPKAWTGHGVARDHQSIILSR
jgi:hypothetical protein